MKPRLFICGHGRHGKDTMAEYLRDTHGYNFISSSLFCAELIVFPALKDVYQYRTVEECYNDRHNHRAEWYNLIAAYSVEDKTRLTREIFNKYDIYVGIRNSEEFLISKHIADISVWVDRSKTLPLEPSDSMNITADMCDVVIDNNGTLEEFHSRIEAFLIYGADYIDQSKYPF
jgi:dephospho-CoA kinase